MHEIVESEPSDLVVLHIDGSGRDEVQLVHDGSPPAVMRKRIDALVQALLDAQGATADFPVEHTIADGMYMRKLFIPKGTLLAGKIHLKDCLNIVASGDISILTEYGSRRVGAGFTGVSYRGAQKIGYAHEDTVFINVFRTDLTDLSEIEAEIAGTKHIEEVELIDPKE
jgi:hypothetical protein